MGILVGVAISAFYILTGMYLIRRTHLDMRKIGEPVQDSCDIMSGLTLIIMGVLFLLAVIT